MKERPPDKSYLITLCCWSITHRGGLTALKKGHNIAAVMETSEQRQGTTPRRNRSSARTKTPPLQSGTQEGKGPGGKGTGFAGEVRGQVIEGEGKVPKQNLLRALDSKKRTLILGHCRELPSSNGLKPAD